MKIKVNLLDHKDKFQKKYPVTMMDGNIIIAKGQDLLPGCNYNFIQFKAGYSSVYSKRWDGVVNTRIQYPLFRGKIGENYLFCKLNWWQRRKLSYILKRSWVHKDPIATTALLISLLALILSIIAIAFIRS